MEVSKNRPSIEAIIEYAKENPPPYRLTDIMDRVTNGRPISAGMRRWLRDVETANRPNKQSPQAR